MDWIYGQPEIYGNSQYDVPVQNCKVSHWMRSSPTPLALNKTFFSRDFTSRKTAQVPFVPNRMPASVGLAITA
jgi:hypothetical protein